jgi:hypothetical protein
LKKLVLILTVFFAQQTFACIDLGSSESVCPGDTVYKGTSYIKGATVLGVNQHMNRVTVRSNYSGDNNSESVFDLHLTRGCISSICVRDVVYKGTSFLRGAIVLAINSHKQTLTIKSNYSGDLSEQHYDDLEPVVGCLYGICVGDLVFKGSSFINGARVISINYQNRTVTVKSEYSGDLSVEDPRNLDNSHR